MLEKISIVGAVAAVLIIPTPLSAQRVGGTVSTSVSRAIPTAADLERSSRSASNYRSFRKHTAHTKPRRRATTLLVVLRAVEQPAAAALLAAVHQPRCEPLEVQAESASIMSATVLRRVSSSMKNR
jgi:hypothetical protein